MTIGVEFESELRTFTDPQTGRTVRQLTSGPCNSYALYYFVPSVTRDGKYLVFHRETPSSGGGPAAVQLYRMDLATGRFVQLTDAHTPGAGWAIFCDHRLAGVRNHLSALDPNTDEVFYFQDDAILGVNVRTLRQRQVHAMANRVSIGQTSFSPDGRHFAFIHADRELFSREIAKALSLKGTGKLDLHTWRNGVPATISVIDTQTGARRDVVALDFHVHHVLWVSNSRLLVNHPRGALGMWCIDLDGGNLKHLRPHTQQPGEVCHQCVIHDSHRGMCEVHYEAYSSMENSRRVWVGRYDVPTDRFEEFELPSPPVWHHTGNDPLGKLCFLDTWGFEPERRGIYVVRFPMDANRRTIELVQPLCGAPRELEGQRSHAHPFLSPDRRWMYHTAIIDRRAQICATDVSDLAESDDFWV